MTKVLLQLLITIAIFFGLWFGLSKVNWRKILHINQISASTEEKFGDLIWKSIEKQEVVMLQPNITEPIDTLVQVLCKANNINYEKLQIHIVEKDEVNAFALPNNHLVVYTGLISDCQNEEELLGVLGHEIAHIEKKHITKKLIKEIGLAAVISIAGGNNGAVQKAIQLLTSSSYDRKLESEADLTSADYLLKAKVNPEPFANFLYRMGEGEEHLPKQAFWISTHPESKERAKEIISYVKNKKVSFKKILTTQQFEQLIDDVNAIDEE